MVATGININNKNKNSGTVTFVFTEGSNSLLNFFLLFIYGIKHRIYAKSTHLFMLLKVFKYIYKNWDNRLGER
jgi:hypothetical protein